MIDKNMSELRKNVIEVENGEAYPRNGLIL